MQFLSETWDAYAVDGDDDGDKDRYDAADAIHSAANYLDDSGAPNDWDSAIYAYNHADWYVADVKQRAAKYRGTRTEARAAAAASAPAQGPGAQEAEEQRDNYNAKDVVNDPNIDLTESAASDFAEGRIDKRVIDDAGSAVAMTTTLAISVAKTGHDKYTTSGSVSNHWYGRAVDIYSVDGKDCTGSDSEPCANLAEELVRPRSHRDRLRATTWTAPARTPSGTPRATATTCTWATTEPSPGLPLAGLIEKLVEQIEGRFAELSAQMSDPEVIGDQRRYAEVGRAYSSLSPRIELAQEWRRSTDDADGARELLGEGGDDQECATMLETAEARLAELEEEIRLAMVEADPNDDKNVIVEVRGGAGRRGGRPLRRRPFRMLTRYAERRGFKTEPLSVADGDYTFAIKGSGAYCVFKHEGGTHRVQRVPETESQGRIHTSTATVAVLPEAEEVDVHVDPNDLQVDVYRSSGPGRPVGEHHRLGGAHHPQADRAGGVDAGREVAAAEPRQGDARAARAPARARARRAAGRGGGRPEGAGGHRRALGEDPHLQLPPGPRDRPPREAHEGRRRARARRRARRLHRRRSRPTRSAASWRPPRSSPAEALAADVTVARCSMPRARARRRRVRHPAAGRRAAGGRRPGRRTARA